MSDKAGAYLFGKLFRELARDDFNKDALAKTLWECMRELDFHWSDMRANEALEKFGFARKRVDPRYPDLGEVWFYGPEGEDQT